MQIERNATEDDMVALFLRCELTSDRWADAIRKAAVELSLRVDIISTPDTSNDDANRQRAGLLGQFRGYRQDRDLFTDCPGDVTWHWAIIEDTDLQRLKYVDYDYWNELTGGTRRPLDAACTVLEGEEVFGVSNQRFLRGAECVLAGKVFEPIILVATDPTHDLVILEGHCRATAYALARNAGVRGIPAMLGISAGFASWV